VAFSMRFEVRGYEIDALGHVNHAVYHQYAEVARTKGFQAAGCDWETLFTTHRTAPVLLSTTVNFRRELRGSEEFDVSCTAKFGDGKTFTLEQLITKADGTLSAEVYCVMGMMDLEARRLHADPRAALESAGFDITVLNG
jgi:acyl-CoA thioester hydrolase